MSRAPYVLYGVKYIDLVSLGANASGAHLDLSRAPYVLYGVKCIDLVSLAPNDGQCQPHLALNHSPYNLYDVKYIDLVSLVPFLLGKHSIWEGGTRGTAFVWAGSATGLIPAG